MLPELLAAPPGGQPDVTIRLGQVPPGADPGPGLQATEQGAVLIIDGIARYAIADGSRSSSNPRPMCPKPISGSICSARRWACCSTSAGCSRFTPMRSRSTARHSRSWARRALASRRLRPGFTTTASVRSRTMCALSISRAKEGRWSAPACRASGCGKRRSRRPAAMPPNTAGHMWAMRASRNMTFRSTPRRRSGRRRRSAVSTCWPRASNSGFAASRVFKCRKPCSRTRIAEPFSPRPARCRCIGIPAWNWVRQTPIFEVVRTWDFSAFADEVDQIVTHSMAILADDPPRG